MSVQVSRDRNRDALCLLRSRDEFGVEVGHLDLRVPADPDGAAQVITSGTVPTIARGVTGETGRCVALDPGAPAPFEDHAPQALIDR